MHLSIAEDLLLKVADLALLVTRLALDWPKRTVVFVIRANSHIVETAV